MGARSSAPSLLSRALRTLRPPGGASLLLRSASVAAAAAAAAAPCKTPAARAAAGCARAAAGGNFSAAQRMTMTTIPQVTATPAGVARRVGVLARHVAPFTGGAHLPAHGARRGEEERRGGSVTAPPRYDAAASPAAAPLLRRVAAAAAFSAGAAALATDARAPEAALSVRPRGISPTRVVCASPPAPRRLVSSVALLRLQRAHSHALGRAVAGSAPSRPPRASRRSRFTPLPVLRCSPLCVVAFCGC
jgi:hypothetical protein